MWQALMAIISGAPGPVPVIEYFLERGVPIQESFGMTECAPTVTMLTAEHVRRKTGSIGRPLFDVEARLVDDRDRDVPVGTVGELLVRGDNVFVGYWMRPEATLSQQEVIAYARQRLAGFKTPTRVEFVRALPRTATGKFQKNELRSRLADLAKPA